MPFDAWINISFPYDQVIRAAHALGSSDEAVGAKVLTAAALKTVGSDPTMASGVALNKKTGRWGINIQLQVDLGQ